MSRSLSCITALGMLLSLLALGTGWTAPVRADDSGLLPRPALTERVGPLETNAERKLDASERQTVLSLTGQQTLLVATVAGGVAIAAIASGGLQPAILAGSAVLAIYMFMP